MKKRFVGAVIALLFAFSVPPSAYAGHLEDYQEQVNDLYQGNCAAEDSAFVAIGSSMIGWGFGLAIFIGLLTGILHQSTSSSHSHSD